MRIRKTCLWILIIGLMLICSKSWGINQTPTGFFWPTGISNPKMGPGFLAIPPEYFDGQYHLGQDIFANIGDRVYAISDGKIISITTGQNSGWGEGNSGLVIQHYLSDGSLFYAVYGHICNVTGNKDVKAGEIIGKIGSYPYGSHLHFGISPGDKAPTSPLGLWYLPTNWQKGQPLDSKGFVNPIVWITTKEPAQQQNVQPTPPPPITDNLQGKWIPGTIHTHTTFSDGSDNIPQRVARAKKEGCRFIVITDHYEQIDNLDKAAYKYGAGKDFGFEDYFRNCREQTSADFITIAGAEIESLWRPETTGEQPAHSHLLALKIKPENHVDWKINQEIGKLQCRENVQLAIVEKIRDLEWIPVAAHPNLIATKSAQLHFWEWQDHRFDFRLQTTLNKLQGIEMFNVETDKQQQDLVDNYLGWLKEGRNFFVISGCDSHNWVDKIVSLMTVQPSIPFEVLREYVKDDDDDRWTRKTWVYVKQLSESSILEAIQQGKTYATKWGAFLENLNYIPGFKVQNVERPKFQFTLMFDKNIQEFKTIRIYRDSVMVEESIQNCPEGSQQYNYSWEDNEVSTGKHFYVIEVPGILITSPINLNIQKAVTVSLQVVNNFMPIISPNHDKIAFASNVKNKQSIWQMNIDGSKLDCVMELPGNHEVTALVYTDAGNILSEVKGDKYYLYAVYPADKINKKIYEDHNNFTFAYKEDESYILINSNGKLVALSRTDLKVMELKEAMGNNPFMFFMPEIWRLMYIEESPNKGSQIIVRFVTFSGETMSVQEKQFVLHNPESRISGFVSLPTDKIQIKQGEGGQVVFSSEVKGNNDIYLANLIVDVQESWYETYHLTTPESIIATDCDEIVSDAFIDQEGITKLLISINKGNGYDIYFCNQDGSKLTQLTFGADRDKVNRDIKRKEDIQKALGIVGALINIIKNR